MRATTIVWLVLFVESTINENFSLGMLQMYILRLIFVAICIPSVHLFLSFKLGRCWTLCTLCGSRTHTCNQKKNFTKFTDLNIFPFQQNLILIFLQQKLHTPYYSSLLQNLLCKVTIHGIGIMLGVPTMETSKTFFKTSVFNTQDVLCRNLITLTSNVQTFFLILYLFSSVRSLIDYSLLLYYQRF